MTVKAGRYECTVGGRNAFYSVVPNKKTGGFDIYSGSIGRRPRVQSGISANEVGNRLLEKTKRKGYVWKGPSLGSEVEAVLKKGHAKTAKTARASGVALPSASLEGDVPKTAADVLRGVKRDAKGAKGGIAFGDVTLSKVEGDSHVPRLNGAYFFPRYASSVASDVLEGSNVMFVGHTGCGKTSLIEQMAARIGQGVIRVNMNGQMSVGDFVGLWTVKGGETVWVDGALPKAMREGYWLIIDEIDFAEPAVLANLNAVLEPGGVLYLKEKGHEAVEAHERFRVFATANTVGCMMDHRVLYQGTNVMNEAFLDRWRVYHVDYLPALEEAKVLVDSVPGLDPRVAKALVDVAGLVRNAARKQEVECTFSLRRLLDWARVSMRTGSAMEAAESTIFAKISSQDSKLVRDLIKRVVG